MVDTSTEAVTKLLDGVTPGPWAYNVHREVGPLHTEDDLAYGMICDVVCEVNFDADHMGNARFIAAARDLVPALLAERDALRRENENLRQIERNVQAVREHEYKRAEAALAEAERLKAQPAQSVKVKRLRYFDPQGDTLDQMRGHARQHPLAKKGDMKLVWVNEGDLYNHALTAIQPVQSVTVRNAAQVPDVRALIEALQNVMGYIDTPISRRRLGINTEQPEWLTSARATIRAIAEGRE